MRPGHLFGNENAIILNGPVKKGKIVKGPQGATCKSTGEVVDGKEVFRYETPDGKAGGYATFDKDGKINTGQKSPFPAGIQEHHGIPKNSKLGKSFQPILDKYGLDVEGAWNKIQIPHKGSHPAEYDRWVLEQVKIANTATQKAGGGAEMFKTKYKELVIDPLEKNPELLNKSGW